MSPLDAANEARAVFVGTVVSTKLSKEGDIIVEDAIFQVTNAFKGVKKGNSIKMRSYIAPGACGKSAINDPLWLEEALPNGDMQKMEIGREWLIYAHGSQPFEISLCSRSLPLVIERARDDIATLEKALPPKAR